jgi:hypothetical protein
VSYFCLDNTGKVDVKIKTVIALAHFLFINMGCFILMQARQ